MRYADVESFCLALPCVTLSIQWGGSHVYKVGGKIFAVMGPPESRPHGLSFKAGESSFYILIQSPGIIPAPYLARAQWVHLERMDALTPKELKAYLTRAHVLVATALPKKTRARLGLAEAEVEA